MKADKLGLKSSGKGNSSRSGGFTLIELLIVIAIILILIAIALPNFLEAQIRARVTKSMGDIRSIGIALDSYSLDWKVYPYESENDCGVRVQRLRCGLAWLTSPIAYITSIPQDPFKDGDLPEWFETGIKKADPQVFGAAAVTFALWTRGPDGIDSELNSDNASGGVTWQEPGDGSNDRYSPTNGTKSRGDIWMWRGDPYWIGVVNVVGLKPAQGIDPLIVEGVPYVHTMPPGSIP